MDSIKVNKIDLLVKLKANRENHRTIFLEAQKGYREMAIAELDKTLQDARDGKRFNRSLSLTAPVDMTKEYDTAIEMLEMSVDKHVTLTSRQFSNYIKDDWAWKQSFLLSNSRYSKSAEDIYAESFPED